MKQKPLYKPFKSKIKNKKFSVYVKGDNGNIIIKHFGDSRYQDFRQHKDEKRRESYRKRARGIKNKKGEYTYLDKNTSNYWSFNYLWG